jgi:hypothetical protein
VQSTVGEVQSTLGPPTVLPRGPTLDAVVEELLLYPPDSPMFEDALARSSQLDREEARREISVKRLKLELRREDLTQRLSELEDEFGDQPW